MIVNQGFPEKKPTNILPRIQISEEYLLGGGDRDIVYKNGVLYERLTITTSRKEITDPKIYWGCSEYPAYHVVFTLTEDTVFSELEIVGPGGMCRQMRVSLNLQYPCWIMVSGGDPGYRDGDVDFTLRAGTYHLMLGYEESGLYYGEDLSDAELVVSASAGNTALGGETVYYDSSRVNGRDGFWLSEYEALSSESGKNLTPTVSSSNKFGLGGRGVGAGAGGDIAYVTDLERDADTLTNKSDDRLPVRGGLRLWLKV